MDATSAGTKSVCFSLTPSSEPGGLLVTATSSGFLPVTNSEYGLKDLALPKGMRRLVSGNLRTVDRGKTIYHGH